MVEDRTGRRRRPDAQLDLTDAERIRLARALGSRPEDAAFSHRLAALAESALREWVDWILSRRRYESISALERDRLLTIFGRVREEAPTAQELVEAFGISESRATSLLSRMRFGAARMIRGLQYETAKKELEAQLANADRGDGQAHVWVTPDTGRLIEEANTAIMMDQTARRAGGKYEGAVKADRVEATRTGQCWRATEGMWRHILGWLDEQATAAREEPTGE